MEQPAAAREQLSKVESERLVRYADLHPCTTAFIDTRSPGSAEKENFTIIGRGVAENPDQHVHIDIPHGFNIGGARQPPGCVNSQHSHETAEVFVVHSGTWAFTLGPDKEDGKVVLGPGDTISIPARVFRGFENVGEDVGYLYAVLGGDDPGHVTWAPYVFDTARDHGLILLDDGSLVDTTGGETIPHGRKPMPATTAADVERLRRMSASELAECVVRHSELEPLSCASLPDLREFPIIGSARESEKLPAGKMSWPHGFHMRYVSIDPGVTTVAHARSEEEVIFVHSGQLTVRLADGQLDMGPADVLTVPIDMPRQLANNGASTTELYVVRGGDDPAPPRTTR